MQYFIKKLSQTILIIVLPLIFLSVVFIPQAKAIVPINNISVSAVKTDSVNISWDSTSAGTSQIEYGTTTSYGSQTTEDSLAYFHTQTITGLTAGTAYNYRIRTKDYDGAENVSGNYTFTTRTQAELDSVITAARRDGGLPKSYYVSPTGNNTTGTGTLANPWATPSYAVSKIDVGDTVYLMDGTYNDLNTVAFTPLNDGIDVAPVTITAYSGTPYFNGNAANIAFIRIGDSGYTPGSIQYITISKLSIHNYSYPIFIRNAGHILIENNTVSNSDDYVDQGDTIWVKEGSSNIIVRNNIFLTSGYNSIEIDGTGGEVHNIIVNNNDFSLNSVHWSLQFGMNATNITANYNTFHDTPYQQCLDTYIGNDGEYLKNYVIIGNFLNDCTLQGYDNSQNGLIENNTIMGDGTFASIVGYGNYYPSSGAADNIIFRNNNQYNTNYEMYLTGGKNILLDRMNVSTSVTSDYYFRDMLDGGKITMRDTITPTFGIRLKSYGNVTIEYTDNSIFAKTGGTLNSEIGIRYYPTVSNATQIVSDGSTDTTYQIQKYPMTATPATGSATVSVASFNTSLPLGSVLANFTADTTNGNNVTFTVSTLKPNTNYLIKKGTADYTTVQADSTGKITFTNLIWPSANFTIIETIGSMPTPIPSIIPIPSITPTPSLTITPSLTPTPTITPTPAPKFSADLNSDGSVNAQDFAILMSAWNSIAKPKADINQDGLVDSLDFGLMMSFWG